MCGVFGILTILNNQDIYNTILNGLIQLQNRGYDSAGISLINKVENKFEIYKYASTASQSSIDKLTCLFLTNKLNINNISDKIGIGHNRWATHSAKTDINAHPHISNKGMFSIVHNGIIENYQELKDFLISNGYIFYSQTDTEVIVNLISYFYNKENDTFIAIQKTIEKLHGTYGIIIMNILEKDTLYTVRNGSPILVGIMDDHVIITSEQSGFCNLVNNYITLNNEDICIINKSNNRINVQTKHSYINKKIINTDHDLTPEPYKYWTLKEICEQPNTIFNAINRGGRIKNGSEVKLGGLEQHSDILKNIDNIILLGCGTSYHAGLYGMYYFKYLCNLNTVQVFDGSDFNIQDIPKIGKTALVLISQSGETKDLHRCIDIAKQNNIFTIGIINVVDSLIAREVNCGIYCNAGREVAVASTKAFTSQVICLSMLAIWFSQIHDINIMKRMKIIQDLHNLSNQFKNTIDSVMVEIEKYAKHYINYNNLFLLGKGCDEYIAREGSLKIKEISYIHSEAYSSSSLKHGPLALIDEKFPVILFNCQEEHHSKIMNCFEEVRSRNANVLLITNNYNNQIKKHDNVKMIYIPKNNSYNSLLGIIPIQLFAYYLSINKNINPDIPKNLAKVVTVE